MSEINEEINNSVYNPLKLDLYNFEDPQYESSKFVLTSPRSLEACSRLSVKPVDLLYKPLAEFQEELLPQDVPLRTIYNIYDEQEQARQKKLQLCREERNRIIDKEFGSKCNTYSNRPSLLISKDEDLDQGSLQRKRTAWATSVGHKRLTNDEINERAKELHEESLKLKRELLSRKDENSKKKTLKKSNEVRSASAINARKSVTKGIRSVSSAPCTKLKFSKQEQRSAISSETRTIVTPRSEQKTPISSETRTLSAVKSDQRIPFSSETRTLLSAKPDQRIPFSSETRTLLSAKSEQRMPLSSQTRTLLTSRSGSLQSLKDKSASQKAQVKIPLRDLKIIKLMKERRKEEIISTKMRQEAHLAWEEERRKEQELRDKAEMRRRHLLAEENRILSQHKQNKDYRNKQYEENLTEQKAQAIESKSKKWETSFSRQQMIKESKLATQKEKEKLQKTIQEKNLQFAEKDENEMSQLVYDKILQDLKTAALKREARLQEETMKKHRANKQERESFEQRKKHCEQIMRKQEEMLRSSLDSKHNKAASKFEHMLNSKLHNLSLMHKQREKRLHKARIAQKRMDEQMATWREGLLEQRKKAEEHAVETVIRTNEMKAERAHKERVEKEKEQKANIKKVQQELMLWHKNLEKSINAKVRKSLLLQEEKELSAMQTRAIAQETQRLRDEVRNKYSSETFDKKAFQANLYAKMGGGFYSSAKNISQVNLYE